MGLFSKKQDVDLEGFCRNFYDKYTMNCVIEGIDVNANFIEAARDLITKVDQTFSSFDSQKLASELLILRFELFGLAWLHQFGEKSAVAQSVFTKNYLHEKGRDDIWDNLEFYNQAIATSSTIGRKTTNGFDRAYLMKVDGTRFSLFKLYHKKGLDGVAVARALNRLFTERAWKKGITVELLTQGLCKRLEFKPNKEAHLRFFSVIHGLYDGSRQSLENIKVWDSR